METTPHHHPLHHCPGACPHAMEKLFLDFFQTYGPPVKLQAHEAPGPELASGARHRLWHWYRTTVSGDYHTLEPLEMANLVQFYDALDELLGRLGGATLDSG